MKAIATINFKGGVGKTTVTWLIAKYIAETSNKRVLIVDSDAQMSLTLAVTIQESGAFITGFEKWYDEHQKSKRTLFHGLEKYDDYATGKVKHCDFPIDGKFIYQFRPNLHFIPSVVDLYWQELDVFDRTAAKTFIQAVLGKIEHSHAQFHYDYVFFDCPPNFSILSFSVLSCCSCVFIPVNPDVFASRGINLMLEGLSLKITPWPSPKILVFMNKAGYNTRWGLFKETIFYRNEVKRVVEKNKQAGIPIEWLEPYIPSYKEIGRAIPLGSFPADFKSSFHGLWSKLETMI